MFSDSEIAKHEMSSTKVMYIIQYGITKYFKDELMKEVQEKPFTFYFDVSITSQTKKQYSCVKFFSLESGEMFRCSAADMVKHLKTFVAKQNLVAKMFLNLGMDGPNVNFQNPLIKELKEKYHTTFIDLGTCSLHSENNGFGKLVKEIDDIVELDQMAIDFHIFFKYSAGRRERSV